MAQGGAITTTPGASVSNHPPPPPAPRTTGELARYYRTLRMEDLFAVLEPGGVYIIEDTECNYWHPESSIYGYRIGFFNAIAETTKLVDLVNAEFSGATNELGVSSLSYGQNCIIITKQTDEERAYFDRTYAGQHRIESPTPG